MSRYRPTLRLLAYPGPESAVRQWPPAGVGNRRLRSLLRQSEYGRRPLGMRLRSARTPTAEAAIGMRLPTASRLVGHG